MPKISSGAARKGRLIYLINCVEKNIGFIWIYTHAEFEKRPPDKKLKDLLEEFIKSSEDLDKNHQLSEDIVSETQEEELEEPKEKKPVSES